LDPGGRIDHSPSSANDIHSERSQSALLAEGLPDPAPVATAAAPELQGFARVAEDDTVLSQSLDELAAFTGLLPQRAISEPK
jgi:hypothetical protein